LHFDGSAWNEVPTPNIGDGNNILSRVVAIGDKVYAVGSAFVGGLEQTLAMQFGPTGWTVMPTPNVGAGDNTLIDVDAAGRTVLAVGRGSGGVLIERFTGTRWVVDSGPRIRKVGVEASGVAVPAPREAHAVGGSVGPDGKARAGGQAKYRFDGERWVAV
jgi:hypothetical protein